MGTDKGMMKYNNIPLVQYPVNLLSTFCKELIISSNNDTYLQFGFPVIADEYPDKGPAGGLAAALKASNNDWNIVLSCDVPFVNKEAIEFLISSKGNSLGVVPVYNGKTEPLIAIYHKSFQSVLESNIEIGNLKMQSIIRHSDITSLEFGPILKNYPNIFQNFNYPGDLV